MTNSISEEHLRERKDLSTCDHCSLPVVLPVFGNSDHTVFCCHGCKTVFYFMRKMNLGDFYHIKKESQAEPNRPVDSELADLDKSDFVYLDSESFLKEYVQKDSGEGQRTMLFYVEGVHCLACKWVVEKLVDFVPHVLKSTLNLPRSLASITLDENGKFSEVAMALAKLGYRPHPVKENYEAKKLALQENRTMLIRLGVAALCSGQIMMNSLSVYVGATGFWEQLFNTLNVIFIFPIIFYSAVPFYQNAYHSIRQKRISLDVPIVLALIGGTAYSLYSFFAQRSDIYFDTLATLVFLLLGSRYLLKRMQQSNTTDLSWTSFLKNDQVQRIKSTESGRQLEKIHMDLLREGDEIAIAPGDVIPADGVVVEGSSQVSNALLTGESYPVAVKSGSALFSGAHNIDSPLTIQVTRVGENSQLGKMLKEIQENWGGSAPVSGLADKVAKRLIISVLILGALIVFGYGLGFGEWEVGISRFLALIIITCPCSLGLATPLAMILSLKTAFRKGMIVKTDMAIEKLARAKNLFLDKTGTLTYGKLAVSKWEGQDSESVLKIVWQLEQNSSHPVAIAIREFIFSRGGHFQAKADMPDLRRFKEIPGLGVEAFLGNDHYIVKSAAQLEDASENEYISCVQLLKNEEVLATITLADQLRPQTLDSLKQLRKLGPELAIISGDRSQSVYSLGKKLGLSTQRIFANHNPFQKKEVIQSFSNTVMVGDGANDALALQAADVGVVVSGGLYIGIQAADVYLTKPGLLPLVDLIKHSQKTMALIKRNTYFSLAYNSIGISFALIGAITPLWAAIFMPLSALTVFGSTLFSWRKGL